MFIGRKQELSFLENKYNQNGGQLIVLYGRRRIGKTETLKEFCKEKKHIFFSCTECSDNMQLKNFSKKMFKEDIPIKKYIPEFNNWYQAFESIDTLPYSDKKLIVIDEFPYMCKNNNEIPSILQNLWDNHLKDKDVMIILCGSSMSFIEKDLLSNKNPLYGRATGIYKMKEMNFEEASLFFPQYSPYDKVLAYSILGGIPHYLKQFNPNDSIENNIKNNILKRGSILYSEVEFLLHSELREISLYNSVIQAIASGHSRLNEISNTALINDNSKTNVYIKNLIELGIVEREISVDAGVKELSNANRGIYQLTDSYFKFWYCYVFPNYSELEDDDVDGVYNYLIKPHINEFASYTFEKICIQFMKKLNKENKLPFRYNRIGKWFGKTNIFENDKLKTMETEIDILAFDKSNYIIGECKFKNSVFTYKDYLNTISKLSHLNNKNIYYYLFSLSGFDSRITQEFNNVKLFTLEDIVSY